MKTKISLLPILILLLIILTTPGCWLKWLNDDDDEPQLPPITQTGEGTFGCLVNGEIWLPKGRFLYSSEYSIDHEPHEDDGIIYTDIYAYHEAKGKGWFRFSVPKDLMKLGKAPLNRESSYEDAGAFFNNNEKVFYFTKESAGELIITSLDTITNNNNVTPYRITAGTFWFDLFSPDGEKIEIRDGRFDFRDYRFQH